MAGVFDTLSKPDRAKALRAKASALFDRFNRAFWEGRQGAERRLAIGKNRSASI